MTPHQAEGADSFRRWCSEEKVNEMWYISSGGSLLSFKHSQHYLQEDVEWGVAQQLRVLFCIFNFVIHVLAYLKWKAFFLFEAFLHGAAYIVCILKVLEDGKVHDTRDPGQPLRLGSLCGSRAVSGHALPAIQQRRSARKGTRLSAGVWIS